MNSDKISSLPPLKRYTIEHKKQHNHLHPHSSSFLPVKKRKQSRDATDYSSYFLPAKKRVWALPPPPEQPVSGFDLNVEYDPYSDRVSEKQETLAINPIENADNDNDEDDDDGIVCAVCESTDGDPSDPIVFCEGCDLMVHATCYGNPLVHHIPEGDWFCNQCSNTLNNQVSCCLCGVKDNGAMKMTTEEGKWAHIVCALYVPEVFFEDSVGRDGIDCSKVPKRRFGLKCYLCGRKCGCCVDCSEPKCELRFHVTCGLKEGLSFEYSESRRRTGTIVAGFCRDHTELWKKQQQTGKFKIVARDEHK